MPYRISFRKSTIQTRTKWQITNKGKEFLSYIKIYITYGISATMLLTLMEGLNGTILGLMGTCLVLMVVLWPASTKPWSEWWYNLKNFFGFIERSVELVNTD